MTTLTRVTATQYAALPHAARLAAGVLIVKESGAPDFKAMVERRRVSDHMETMMRASGFSWEQACRVADVDERKGDSGPLPF